MPYLPFFRVCAGKNRGAQPLKEEQMNVLHMKYAVEIAKAGSINKASEALLIAQPNLSRSIKELEADLGIAIFERSSKGMALTPDGEEFIRHAQRVLEQIEEVERLYQFGAPVRQRFCVCAPRAGYISDAFAQFCRGIDAAPAQLLFMETGTAKAVGDMLSGESKLGVIRYAAQHDPRFTQWLEEKGLLCETVAEFAHVLVMSSASALAAKAHIAPSDLSPLIEIAQRDATAHAPHPAAILEEEDVSSSKRRVFVCDRASQLDLLVKNPETFAWTSPMSRAFLERNGLTQRAFAGGGKPYRDVLIRRRDYALTALDKAFIRELYESKRAAFGAD